MKSIKTLNFEKASEFKFFLGGGSQTFFLLSLHYLNIEESASFFQTFLLFISPILPAKAPPTAPP